MGDVLLETEFDLPLVSRGKVRDIYAIEDKLLFVTTDRLSAFDVVFGQGIPGKGEVLTRLSKFWAKRLHAAQPYHLVTTDVDEMGNKVKRYANQLRGRSMLVERLEMLPVECVVRGYLVGSGWKDYQATGKLCGHDLPDDMENGDRLDRPLFTPATKADVGDHDENISFEQVIELVGEGTANDLRSRSIKLFEEGVSFANDRGLVLVDTKFEFGRRKDGTLVLADEVLTADSSRYWDIGDFQKTKRGSTPPSFDKQIVRDFLETQDWNKKPPAPQLPEEIISRTAARYRELVDRLGA